MSDHVHDRGTDPSTDHTEGFTYPWAAAPDIIRSHQKDAYFQSVLLNQLSSVIRSVYGARTAHNWTNEVRTFTELLYLGLTTFIGNRTLGEEYCDIVQVADDTHALPSLTRRAGYILSSVLLPYTLTKFLPALRRRLRRKLESSLTRSHRRRTSSPSRLKAPPTRAFQLQSYLLKHLDTVTSPGPLYALSLATFYFTGAYYQLSKRLVGLRYIFTRKLVASDQRAGYEVLGVLLVLQMVVQGYLHVQQTYEAHQATNHPGAAGAGTVVGDAGDVGPAGDVEEVVAAGFSAPPLLFEAPSGADPAVQRERIAKLTHTATVGAGGKAGGGEREEEYRFDLKDGEVMRWIESGQQRKCTLCLEGMKDPSVTTCGHVFCWMCVTDWLREQPMCPLCRQSCLVQHVLPLRG